MSFSKYPTQLDDNSSLPETVDLVTPVKAEVVNRLREAIIATQTELGIDPSSTFGTVRARLDNINSLIGALDGRITVNEGELDGLDIIVADLQAQITALEADLASEVADLQSQIDSLTSSIASATQVVSPLVAGNQLVENDTYTAVGANVINPTELGAPNATFTIEAIIQTTDSSFAADLILYNITEGTTIGHPTISSTSLFPEFISVTLTVGGSDLPIDQDNIIEARLKIGTGAADTDRAICKYASIRTLPS